MKYYLIGYDKQKNPTVVFFDISDLDEQEMRGMSILTFTEEEIDYTYTGTEGKDYKEVHNAAPDFYSYEVIDEKEYKKRGLDKHFGNNNTTNSSNSSTATIVGPNGLGAVPKTITLSTGTVVDMGDPSS